MNGELAVQCSKLHEWLLARRLIPDNYARLLSGVEAKVSEAVKESVTDEIAKALISEHREAMTFFAARDIYEALSRSPEGQGKTLLGTHTHPGVAKWKTVLDAYRRRHLGWASEARLLIQNVSYNIPALKEQAAACERQVLDCKHREGETIRIEANAKHRYEELLREFGIEGFDPRKELWAHATAELPKLNAELLALLHSSGEEVVKYYQAFAEHAAGTPIEGTEFLPLLRAFLRCGNFVRMEDLEAEVPALQTLHEEEKTHGDAVTQIGTSGGLACNEGPQMTSGIEQIPIADDTPGINWGDTAGNEGGDGNGNGSINWDFEVAEDGNNAAGSADLEVRDFNSGIEVSQDTGGIDWGAISFEGLEIRCEEDDKEEALDVTAGTGSDRLLSDRHVREILYQEILEVGAFLQVRCAELASNSHEDYGPAGIEKSIEEVKAFAAFTNKADDLLAGKTTQRLLLLQSSQRYMDQHVKRFELAKAQCGKPVVQRAALEKARVEQAEEARRVHAEIKKMRTATQKTQKELEAELTAHFRADVRIVGEIAQI